MIRKIVSGGQTGVDRAALDVAIELGYEHGGWIPRGRLAEDGTVPSRYDKLQEAADEHADTRTRLNVQDSDATVILARGELSGGTAYTRLVAEELGTPHLVLDLTELNVSQAARALHEWLTAVRPHVLNVAGPRASKDPGIYELALAVLRAALSASFDQEDAVPS